MKGYREFSPTLMSESMSVDIPTTPDWEQEESVLKEEGFQPY